MQPAMNHVERFRAVMDFQPVDRWPRWEWAHWWDLTINRWHQEGLPEALTDDFEIAEYFGLDPYKMFYFFPMEDVLHVRPGAVSNMDDYRRIRPSLYPDQSAAIAAMQPWARKGTAGEAVVWVILSGFFMFPNHLLLGCEKGMMAYYHQPELVHQMNQDLLNFNLQVLDQMGRTCVPTLIVITEDMADKHGPMVSRRICDQFLTPYYRQLLPRLRDMNAVILVDTDGNMMNLAPWFQEVGVDGVLPLERQAGVDGMILRERHPWLRMLGHFNKLVMHRGEAAIRSEFERLVPLMRTGGFVPGVDHQTPPEVSLEDYRLFLRLLNEYTVNVS